MLNFKFEFCNLNFTPQMFPVISHAIHKGQVPIKNFIHSSRLTEI